MVIVRKEELQDYSVTMDLIAVVVLQASVNSLHEMKDANHSDIDIIKASREIGRSVGQLVLDAVIETTTNLDRDALIRYMAQSMATSGIIQMNNDPAYRDRITEIAKMV